MDNFKEANKRINQLIGVTKPLNKNTMKTQSNIKTSEFFHYYVNDALFIDYEDALTYCEKLLLPYSVIEKTKEYR